MPAADGPTRTRAKQIARKKKPAAAPNPQIRDAADSLPKPRKARPRQRQDQRSPDARETDAQRRPVTAKRRKDGQVVTRTFAGAEEARAYTDRLAAKKVERAQAKRTATSDAVRDTKVLGTPERKRAFRKRTEELREQAEKSFEHERKLVRETSPRDRGPGIDPGHRVESRANAERELEHARERAHADAPRQARGEIGVERKKADPVVRRARKRKMAKAEKRIVADNKTAKAIDEQELADQGFTSGGTTERGLIHAEKRYAEERAKKAQRKEREKRRSFNPKQLAENAVDELKDTVASTPASIKELAHVTAEQAEALARRESSLTPRGLAEKVIGIDREKKVKTPHTDTAVEGFKETSPAYALAHGDVKEAVGRAQERPLAAIGEAAVGAGAVTKAARAGAAVKEGGASVEASTAAARARRARTRARPDLVVPNRPAPKPPTPAAKKKAKKAARQTAGSKARDARRVADARARGQAAEPAGEKPRTGDVVKPRSYSRNAAVRVVQKSKDRAAIARGKDPSVATGRKAKRVRKRRSDAGVRNAQAGGILGEEEALREVRGATRDAGARKDVLRRASLELLTNGRVRYGKESDDLRAIRGEHAAGSAPDRERNLQILDELIEDADGGGGHIRDPEIREAATRAAAESRRGDEKSARIGYAEKGALDFVTLLQGPAARGEVRRRPEPKKKAKRKGRGVSTTLPRTPAVARRSIVDEQNPQRGVMMGERGGGMNPGEQPPKRVDPATKADPDLMAKLVQALHDDRVSRQGGSRFQMASEHPDPQIIEEAMRRELRGEGMDPAEIDDIIRVANEQEAAEAAAARPQPRKKPGGPPSTPERLQLEHQQRVLNRMIDAGTEAVEKAKAAGDSSEATLKAMGVENSRRGLAAVEKRIEAIDNPPKKRVARKVKKAKGHDLRYQPGVTAGQVRELRDRGYYDKDEKLGGRGVITEDGDVLTWVEDLDDHTTIMNRESERGRKFEGYGTSTFTIDPDGTLRRRGMSDRDVERVLASDSRIKPPQGSRYMRGAPEHENVGRDPMEEPDDPPWVIEEEGNPGDRPSERELHEARRAFEEPASVDAPNLRAGARRRKARSIEERVRDVNQAIDRVQEEGSVTSGRGSAKVTRRRQAPDPEAQLGRDRAELKRDIEERSATLARQAQQAEGMDTNLGQAVEIEQAMRNVRQTLDTAPEGSRGLEIARTQLAAFTAQYRQLMETSAVVRKRADELRDLAAKRRELAEIPIRERSTPDKGTVADEAFVPKVEPSQTERMNSAVENAQRRAPESATSGRSAQTPEAAGEQKVSGSPNGEARAPTPDDAQSNALWEDSRTGEPIRGIEDLLRYHEEGQSVGFVRGTKPARSDDRTPGAPVAGHGYEASDLLGPLGENRLADSALERERRATLRRLYEVLVGDHALRDESGEVIRAHSPEEAAKHAVDGFVPLKHRPERGDERGKEEYVLVPDFMAKRVRSQLQPAGRFEAAGRWATRMAIRATLPFSILWHAGNTADLMLRLALSLTPEELAQSGQVARALEGQLEKLGPEVRAEVMASLKGHFGSRETVRDPRLSGVIEGRRNRSLPRWRVAEISDAVGDFTRKWGPGRIVDAAFDISSDVESLFAVGGKGHAGWVPNAFGAAAIRYAKETGNRISDVNEQMRKVADDVATDPAKLHDLQNRVLEIIGDFATRTPAERKLMAGIDVYWTWLRESTRFILKTLPERHPKKTALMFMAASLTQSERTKAGINYYWDDEELDRIREQDPTVHERLDGFLAGSLGDGSEILPAAPFTSFGEVAGNLLEPERLVGRVGSYAQRPIAAATGHYRTPAEVGLKELDDESWIAQHLQIGEGDPDDLDHHGDSATRAANTVAESLVPGLHQARQYGEQGGVPAPASTALHPRVQGKDGKPGGRQSRFEGFRRIVDPTKRQQRLEGDPVTPKGPAAPPGGSYTITFTDPATGKRVTRRVFRRK